MSMADRRTGLPLGACALLLALPAGAETGHDAHMDDDPLLWTVHIDELEAQERSGRDGLAWDVTAWAGNDRQRAWLRAEGSRAGSRTEDNELELLWGRPVAAWWDLLLGVRHDSLPGPARSYAALGVQGLAPYRFDIEATLYWGERGQSGLGIEAEHDLLLTNRLVLTPELELVAWGRDDEVRRIGNGLSRVTAGLRLRYVLRRELAPYIGVQWVGSLGDTTDLARVGGDEVRDLQALAGVRAWF